MTEIYNLFDIANPKQWKTISSEDFDVNGKYNVYGANGIIGKTNTYNHEKETVLITCRGATCGTINLSEPYSYINGNAMALDDLDKSKAVIKYVYYFFQNYNFQNIITGSAQPQITRESLRKVEIPLPDLETQNKIVAILDKTKAIQDKREEVIKKYDELLRANFAEIFGNPMERPSQWDVRQIRENIIDITAGTSYGGDNKKELLADELGVLKVSAVTKGVFDPLEYKAVKKELITKSIVNPQKGDLLFSRANTLELVGATCIVHKDYFNLFLSDKLWKITTDEGKLRKVYLHYVLQNRDVRKTFLSIATGSSGSMLNISMDKFKSIEIPLPPVELQLRFEKEYLKCIQIKNKLIEHSRLVKELYNSLSKLAFAGDLKFEVGIDLEVLLEQDYQFFIKNINNISNKTIEKLLIRLDKSELNENKFYDQETYDKAKNFVFELLKEEKVKQVFDEKTKRIALIV